MRFSQGHAEVQAEGFGESQDFSIAASGKAFKGLIDGLYSRKVEAIIRELATNAFDGQKAAGYIGPFDLHLPSALEPVFWVRDFGTGMTHRHIMTRYTTMFDSTKDGLNTEDADINPDEQVGCLGLGSKVFFAYTDACTLTVWQAGEMRVYSVYMGSDGVPKVAHAGTMASDEPSGVKVEFAVKTKDFTEFRNAASRVFKGFPFTPNGLPMDVIAAVSVEPTMIGAFWKSYPNDYLPDGGFYARQGCVLYPIDLAQVDSKATEDEDGNATLSTAFQKYANNANTIVIDFPIGSIGFDLSRERLSYDERTVRALRKRWQEFTDDLSDRIRSSFSAMGTSFARMQAALTGPAKHFGALFDCSQESIEAQALQAAIWACFPKHGSEASEGKGAILHAIRKPSTSPLVQTPDHYRHRQAWRAPEASSVAEAAFVFRDEIKPHEKIRIGLWMQENDIEWVFVLRPGKLTPSLWKSWGRPPITRLSDIPKVPKMPKQASSGGGGGGGVFDRFKIIDDRRYCYADVTNDAAAVEMDDRYFALINKGALICQPNGYEALDADDVIHLHHLVKRFHGLDISFINTRTNDREGRWDEFPTCWHLLDKLVEDMPEIFVKRIVNVLNRIRYRESRYIAAYNHWSQTNPHSVDPIMALRRFDDRYETIPETDRHLCIAFINRAGVGVCANRDYFPVFREKLNQVIDRARAMGLEVLPPMGAFRGTTSDNITARILPRRWESVVTVINNKHQSFDLFFKLLLKETTTSC